MDLRTALRQGTSLLESAGIPVPRLTAEVLLCHALQRERTYLYSHPEAELQEVGWIHYGRYLHERLQGKPTQYITKRQEFYGRNFRVTPDVLIPRPETEFVVSATLERIRPGDLAIDVGCGSGAIGVTLALESAARVIATDLSPAALQVAQKNALALGASLSFVCGDLLEAVDARVADVLVSNPPYISLMDLPELQREVRDFEPAMALFAGDSGTCVYERLVRDASQVLRPGGWLVLELGWKSADPVRAMLGAGWAEISLVPDLAGIPRVLCARLTE